MKIKYLLPALCPLGIASAATISINEATAPTNLITSQTSHGGYTRAFSNHSSGDVTRGNTFLAPDTGDATTEYSMTGLTIVKSSTQTFAVGATLNLWIFEWNPTTDGNDDTNWLLGGGTSDPLTGTGMNSLFEGSFSIGELTLNGGTYITFDLSDAPLTLTENTSYGFLLGFEDPAESQQYFQLGESGGVGDTGPYLDGMEIRSSNAENTVYTPRDVGFYVSTIPEPSAALLGAFGMLGLLRRRR